MSFPATRARSCEQARRRLERYLLERQTADGEWRDFPGVEVGESTAWTTAYAGFALSASSTTAEAVAGVHAACRRLRTVARPHGWGYNDRAAADADSTAWALRLLLRVDALADRVAAAAVLCRYVQEDGSVSTFEDERVHGEWSVASDEVGPVVGIALDESGAGGEVVRRIARRQRRRLAAGAAERPGYWWESGDYALCWNARLFARVGEPVPDAVVARFHHRLGQASVDDAYSTALLLLGAPLGALRRNGDLCSEFVGMLAEDEWSPGACLLVPPQRSGGPTGRHGDTGCYTGATLLLAVRRMQGVVHDCTEAEVGPTARVALAANEPGGARAAHMSARC